MSTWLTIVGDDREWRISRPNATLLNALLHEACKHFAKAIDTTVFQLRDGRQSRSVDLALPLRLAQLPHTAKLELVTLPTPRSTHCHITLTVKDGEGNAKELTDTFEVTATFAAVLSQLQAAHPELKLVSYHGIPPPEKNVGYTLTITRPGQLQAVVETPAGQRVNTDQHLAATTLESLGLRSATGAVNKARLKLSHQYTAPPMCESDQQKVIQKFQTKFHSAVSEIESERGAIRQREEKEAAQLKSLVIPADRRRRLFVAPVGMLQHPELPEEFYEVTPQDSELYAQSIIQQARRQRAEQDEERVSKNKTKNEIKLPPRNNQPTHRPKPLVAVVRVKFPQHIYAEGMFKVNETVGDVRSFVRGVLAEESMKFQLFVTPPKQTLNDDGATLKSLGLVGAVLVHLTFEVPHSHLGTLSSTCHSSVVERESKEEATMSDELKGAETKDTEVRQIEMDVSSVVGAAFLRPECLAQLEILPAPALSPPHASHSQSAEIDSPSPSAAVSVS